MKKSAPAAAAALQPRPTSGGSYTADPITGELIPDSLPEYLAPAPFETEKAAELESASSVAYLGTGDDLEHTPE